MITLDFFIVNVAIPTMQRDLHASASDIQWTVAGYGLAIAAGVITAGRLGDLYGRRRMYAVGLAVFHARVARLRARRDGSGTRRGPRGTGHRRRTPHPTGARDREYGVHRTRTDACLHRVRPDDGHRRRLRSADRRSADPGRRVRPRLAYVLPHQPADRHRRARADPADRADLGRDSHGTSRPDRDGHRDVGPRRDRSADDRGPVARLAVVDVREFRRRRRTRRGVRRLPARIDPTRRRAAHRPVDVPVARVRGRDRHPDRVLDRPGLVLPRVRDLSAGRSWTVGARRPVSCSPRSVPATSSRR